MIAVADATPLHYLVIIGHSGVLPQIFKRITIPPAVATELSRPKTPGLVRAWISRSPAWLDIRSAPQSEAADLEWLGAGEREAILLAEEIRADWLIIDDHHGRKAAARHRVPSSVRCAYSMRQRPAA
jgi:predicted nucleic acid-binding protein